MAPDGESEDVQDRELRELLNELRVVLPGVTVLFSFLLTVPFSTRYNSLGMTARAAFLTAFLGSGAAVVLLVGESAYHRLVGKPYDKQRMLRTASRQAVTAIGLLGVALAAVVFFVVDVLYERDTAVLLAAGMTALVAGTWFVLPLSRRLRR